MKSDLLELQGIIKHCKGCGLDLPLSYYYKAKAEPDGLQRRCKDCCMRSAVKHKAENPEYFADWVSKNRERFRELKRNSDRKRRKDPKNKLIYNIRSRTSFIVKSKGMIKSRKCREYLGCEAEYFIKYIESKFINGMTWDNYGDWEIDHICPISKASEIEDVYRLNHYTNLRPLWKHDNRRKRDKFED